MFKTISRIRLKTNNQSIDRPQWPQRPERMDRMYIRTPQWPQCSQLDRICPS